MTRLGHCLVLGLRPEYFALSGVGLPLGHEAFGSGARTEAGHICTMIPVEPRELRASTASTPPLGQIKGLWMPARKQGLVNHA